MELLSTKINIWIFIFGTPIHSYPLKSIFEIWNSYPQKSEFEFELEQWSTWISNSWHWNFYAQKTKLQFLPLELLSTKIKISILSFRTPIHKNFNFQFMTLELLSTKIKIWIWTWTKVNLNFPTPDTISKQVKVLILS